jgi:hypothetical protein
MNEHKLLITIRFVARLQARCSPAQSRADEQVSTKERACRALSKRRERGDKGCRPSPSSPLVLADDDWSISKAEAIGDTDSVC